MSSVYSTPRISAIIPVYNDERYLGEAIDSVLRQDRDDCEIVIVDDGSTDRTSDVARSFGSRVRYVPKEHGGIGSARTMGINAALGQYVAFLDADDLWMEGKLTLQLAAFEADPTLDLVYAHVRQGFNPDASPQFRSTKRIVHDVAPCHLPGALLATASAVKRVGPFNATRALGEGIDWYLRAVDLGLHIATLPDVLLWRRVHEANTGIRARDSRSDYLHLIKEVLDRRRAATQIHHGDTGEADAISS